MLSAEVADLWVVTLSRPVACVAGAVRVGAVIARGPVRDRFLADRAAESMYVSGVLQSAALDVVLQPAWRAHLRTLRRQLQTAEVELVANLAHATVSLRQVLKMKPGDVIPVVIPEVLNVEVDGVAIMECKYGQQSNQYALKVERFIAADNPDAPQGEANG